LDTLYERIIIVIIEKNKYTKKDNKNKNNKI